MINKKELIELYINKQLSQSKIGEIFGCDRKNVTYYLKKYDIPRRTANETKEITKIKNGTNYTIDDVLRMFESGMLITEIANELNVSRGAISKFLKKNGYNFRNNKNSTKLHSEFMKVNNPIPKGITRDVEHIKKISETKKKNYIDYLNGLDISTISFTRYSRLARNLAYSHCFGKKIENGYHIDHIFSIRHGYDNRLPITLISHVNNLRVIPKTENLNKGYKSLVSLEEFYNLVGVQRLSKTQLEVGSE